MFKRMILVIILLTNGTNVLHLSSDSLGHDQSQVLCGLYIL